MILPCFNQSATQRQLTFPLMMGSRALNSYEGISSFAGADAKALFENARMDSMRDDVERSIEISLNQ